MANFYQVSASHSAHMVYGANLSKLSYGQTSFFLHLTENLYMYYTGLVLAGFTLMSFVFHI